MNKFEEKRIVRQAKEKALEVSSMQSCESQMFMSYLNAKQVDLGYKKIMLLRELIETPDAKSREINESDANKVQLAAGAIGVLGAVAASAVTGNTELGQLGVSAFVGGVSAVALSGAGILAYESNIKNKIATTIKKSKLKRNIAKTENDEKKENFYLKTLQDELEMI